MTDEKRKVTFALKYLPPHHVELSDVEKVSISEEVKDLVRDSAIISLQDLLNSDAKLALQRLANQYWGSR